MRETFAYSLYLPYLKDVLGVKYLPRELLASPISIPENATELSQLQIPADHPFSTQASVIAPLSQSRPMPGPTPAVSTASLAEMEEGLRHCSLCKLHKGRKNVVFGAGPLSADLMFVGEGPGEQEDIQGLPFVGPAGELLNKMIVAMGLQREHVYIANVVKCRPPMNRNPEADEIHQCSPFLRAQIKLVNPKIIVALGTFAAQTLLQTDERIGKLRGSIREFENRRLVATYHPSYLLRNPSEKKAAWEDLKIVMKFLNEASPS